MPPFDAEAQRKLREFETPTFGYRLDEDGEIESTIFDGDLPDGWADSPASAKPAKSKAKNGGAAKTEPKAEGDGGKKVETAPDDPGRSLDLPYDQHRFNVLRMELQKRTGKGPPVGTDTAALIGMLEALDADPPGQGE